MSFPYHFVDYSNPATPRVYSWEVPAEQQDAMQMPPQDPSTMQQQHQQPQQQQERVSPSQLQLQQLPPPPMPQMAPQDAQQQHQHQHQQPQQAPQQQQQQQRQQAQYTPHPPTISLQPQAGQPQYRFDNITEEHFAMQAAAGDARPSSSSSRRRGASRPPLQVDTSRASSVAVASPSALSSAGAGAGPLRAPRAHAHAQSAHPYRRPQSRAASGSSAGAAPVRSRRVSELQSAETSTSAGCAPSAMPAVGTAMAVSCPASDTWREGLLGLSAAGGQAQAGTSHDPEATPTATPRGQADHLPFAEPLRRYGIRADIHYSTEDNVIIAMFELPGVKRTDLRVTMSVCPFTRVRQVNIVGASRPILPLQGHGVRERKFGQFMRTLAVPPETKAEDVQVTLEDGILTMKIPGGTQAQAEQPQEIAIL